MEYPHQHLIIKIDRNDGFMLHNASKRFGGQATPDHVGQLTGNVPQCY